MFPSATTPRLPLVRNCQPSGTCPQTSRRRDVLGSRTSRRRDTVSFTHHASSHRMKPALPVRPDILGTCCGQFFAPGFVDPARDDPPVRGVVLDDRFPPQPNIGFAKIGRASTIWSLAAGVPFASALGGVSRSAIADIPQTSPLTAGAVYRRQPMHMYAITVF